VERVRSSASGHGDSTDRRHCHIACRRTEQFLKLSQPVSISLGSLEGNDLQHAVPSGHAGSSDREPDTARRREEALVVRDECLQDLVRNAHDVLGRCQVDGVK